MLFSICSWLTLVVDLFTPFFYSNLNQTILFLSIEVANCMMAIFDHRVFRVHSIGTCMWVLALTYICMHSFCLGSLIFSCSFFLICGYLCILITVKHACMSYFSCLYLLWSIVYCIWNEMTAQHPYYGMFCCILVFDLTPCMVIFSYLYCSTFWHWYCIFKLLNCMASGLQGLSIE